MRPTLCELHPQRRSSHAKVPASSRRCCSRANGARRTFARHVSPASLGTTALSVYGAASRRALDRHSLLREDRARDRTREEDQMVHSARADYVLDQVDAEGYEPDIVDGAQVGEFHQIEPAGGSRAKLDVCHATLTFAGCAESRSPSHTTQTWPVAGLRRFAGPCAASQSLAESGRRVSNPRPSAWEADALPTELRPQVPVDASDRPLRRHPPTPLKRHYVPQAARGECPRCLWPGGRSAPRWSRPTLPSAAIAGRSTRQRPAPRWRTCGVGDRDRAC